MDELKPNVVYSNDEGEDADLVVSTNDSEYQPSDVPEPEDDELLDDDVVAEDDDEQEQDGDDEEEEEEEKDPKDGDEEYKPPADESPEDEKDEDEEVGLGGGEDQESKAKADPSAELDGAPETGKPGDEEEQEPADAGEVAVGEEGKSTEEDALELAEKPAAELEDPADPISIHAREDAEIMLEAAEDRLEEFDHLPSYVQAKLQPVFVNHLAGKGKVASFFPPDSDLVFQPGVGLVELAQKLLEDRDVIMAVDDIRDFIMQTVDLYAKLGMELFRPAGADAEGAPDGPTKALQVLFGKSVLLPCVLCSTILPFILLLLFVNLSYPFRGASQERLDDWTI